MRRISWKALWIEMATLVSLRSADEKMRVGCIVVSADNTKILSLGYNGDHMGGPNVRDSMEGGNSGFIHAEVNALIKLDFSSHLEKIMYVTHSPCEMCAKAIINAGIKKVYYNELYSEKGLDLLRSSNINVEKIELGE
jgi:dCMP deaminase